MNDTTLLIIIPAAMIATAVATYLITQYKANQVIEELQWESQERIITLEKEHARRVHEVFTDAKTAALDDARKLMKSQEKEMRADSVKRSKVVTLGKIAEHFAPYLPGWHYNPQDARFLGSPIDFVVFDGMSEGVINGVVFVEIKTGNAHLSAREQDLQDIICLKKVRYEIIRIPSK